MNRKQIILVISLCISIIVFTFCGWLLFRYLRRWALVGVQREAVQQVRHELTEYQGLGFDEETELIALLQKRLQYQRMRKRAVKYEWKIAHNTNESDREHLQKLFDLNKKMLAGYVQDLQEYRKLGMPTSCDIIRFSYDKMVRLTIALSELERQLAACPIGGCEGVLVADGAEGEFGKRVRRMKEITTQSIAQYKDALRVYYDEGVDTQDPRIQFLRTQLTARVKQMNQLDTIRV